VIKAYDYPASLGGMMHPLWKEVFRLSSGNRDIKMRVEEIALPAELPFNEDGNLIIHTTGDKMELFGGLTSSPSAAYLTLERKEWGGGPCWC